MRRFLRLVNKYDTSYYPWWAHHNIHTVNESISKQSGSHSLKFGGTWQWSQTPVAERANLLDRVGPAAFVSGGA